MGAGGYGETPYQAVARLLAWVTTDQDLDGALLLRGVDIDKLPWVRAINAAYALLMENADEKQRFRFESNLLAPLPGQHMSDEDFFWQGADKDAALFEAALGGTEGL